MASTRRLLKERANIARSPIPYVSFHDDAGDNDLSMNDAGADGNISEWRFVLALDPVHDSLGDASDIGRAAGSPYCNPPPSSSAKKSGGGILSGVTRAAKSSKKSSSDMANSSSSSSGAAYFAFQLDFPPNYPFKPPTITVLGQRYHPNINKETGAMCDAMLTGDEWGPTLNVRRICARLRKFLCDPDPDHPLEGDLAALLVEKPGEYASAAFGFAREHATRVRAEDAMRKGKQVKR